MEWSSASSNYGLHLPTFAMPHFAVPQYLDKPPSDYIAMNLVPVFTMAACIPTLGLFLFHGDYINFALYGLGFVVAVVYHLLQLGAHAGLASVSFLGLTGAGWRTIDILSANMLLARTFGHALNVDRSLVAALPNVLLPACILSALTSYEGATLSLCSRMTGIAMLGTLCLQLALDGRLLLQQLSTQYRDRQMANALLAMVAGLVLFALPSHPSHSHMYWLWHSAWHVAMGWGYYYLYQGLMDRHWPAWYKVRSLHAGSPPAKGMFMTAYTPHSASAQDLYSMQGSSPAGSYAGDPVARVLERNDSAKSGEAMVLKPGHDASKARRSPSPTAMSGLGMVTRSKAKAGETGNFTADIQVTAGSVAGQGRGCREEGEGEGFDRNSRRRSARRL